VAVSVDGLEKSNDLIRGINGYFGLALEGIKLLRGKKVVFSVTLNKISAMELSRLREVADSVGAEIDTNILSQSLFFFKGADIASMWPDATQPTEIVRFVRDEMKRPNLSSGFMLFTVEVHRYFSRSSQVVPMFRATQNAKRSFGTPGVPAAHDAPWK
jgi:MoaA/NifB/PqqE/SkfB family radical SAM enzyme